MLMARPFTAKKKYEEEGFETQIKDVMNKQTDKQWHPNTFTQLRCKKKQHN